MEHHTLNSEKNAKNFVQKKIVPPHKKQGECGRRFNGITANQKERFISAEHRKQAFDKAGQENVRTVDIVLFYFFCIFFVLHHQEIWYTEYVYNDYAINMRAV